MATKKTISRKGKKEEKEILIKTKNSPTRKTKPVKAKVKAVAQMETKTEPAKKKKTTKLKIKTVTRTKRVQAAPQVSEVRRPLKKQIYLSVIIPAYNEAERLPVTLVDIDKRLQDMNLPGYEILVVDDGSRDNTASIVEKFSTLIKNLKLIGNTENHGKGYVVRQGMLEASGEVRLFMDADNSTTIDQFLKMKTLFDEGSQIVIGSRAIKGAELDPPQPFQKRLLGKAGNLFIQLMAVPGIWDTQCGFKAFKRTAAEDIFSRAIVDKWAFDIEALALAKKLGYEIKEVPVYWKNDINSHVTAAAYFQVLLETVRIAYRVKKGQNRVVMTDNGSGAIQDSDEAETESFR